MKLVLAIALFAAACSSGGGADPGHPRPDGGGLGNGSGDGGGGGGANPDGGSTGGSAYCGQRDATECACGSASAQGLTENASCGPGNVGSPSLCCASAAWPSATPGNFLDVECVCSQIFCELDAFGDVCQCGFAAPQQGDTPKSSCTGAVCCRSRSTLAPVCACYTQNIPCDSDEEQVPSCAPSDLRCSDQEVSSCH